MLQELNEQSKIPSEPSATPMLQKLSEQHHAMVDAVLVGMDATQIAKSTGRSIVGVRNILASPLFGQELARRRAELRKRQDEASISIKTRAYAVLESAAEDAAERQVKLIHSEDERVAQTAVTSLFDRLWPKENSKVIGGGDQVGVKVVLGPEAILNLQQVLKEVRDGQVEDKVKIVSAEVTATSNV